MTNSLQHRGPDDYGTWVDTDVGVGLGHTRLSIQDISAQGSQPMVAESGRYVLVYNGEIYNAGEIRTKLQRRASSFRGHSDTEVLLAAIDRWGVQDSIDLCNGMFAFAVWDKSERTLTLVRDRIGIKPLYYGWVGGNFVFASELKAFARIDSWNGQIKDRVLNDYLRFGHVSAPDSIFEGIYKLPQGCSFDFQSGSNRTEFCPLPGGSRFSPRTYWRATDYYPNSTVRSVSSEDAEDELYELLADAVKCRLITDVNLGAFLSGGIDSSLVVALMASAGHSVNTFTIGFAEDKFNEAQYASEVSRHLGTNHSELILSTTDAMKLVPNLPSTFDEPFGDSSALPTLLVSELAKKDVTVVLSGDGGDELFCGYERYSRLRKSISLLSKIPGALRQCAGLLAQPLGQSAQNKFGRLVRSVSRDTTSSMYEEAISQWQIAPSIDDSKRLVTNMLNNVADVRVEDLMMTHDLLQYLSDDILVKVDRASMAHSLEARVPLLDYRVVEFARKLPLSMKQHAGESKWLLRRILGRHVPGELIDRPKQGFGIPLGEWLRGPLHDWASDLVHSLKDESNEFLATGAVQNRWQSVIEGSDYGLGGLWNVLVYKQWLRFGNDNESIR